MINTTNFLETTPAMVTEILKVQISNPAKHFGKSLLIVGICCLKLLVFTPSFNNCTPVILWAITFGHFHSICFGKTGLTLAHALCLANRILAPGHRDCFRAEQPGQWKSYPGFLIKLPGKKSSLSSIEWDIRLELMMTILSKLKEERLPEHWAYGEESWNTNQRETDSWIHDFSPWI